MQLKRFFAPCLAFALALPGACAFAGDLTVTIDGLASGDGKVMVALFGTAGEFPRGKSLGKQAVPAAKGAVSLVFKAVPAGRYALSAFHDLNGNERLDASMLGVPTEPFGTSRDARGRLGPPSFEDAAVTVGSEPVSLTIKVH